MMAQESSPVRGVNNRLLQTHEAQLNDVAHYGRPTIQDRNLQSVGGILTTNQLMLPTSARD